MVVVFLSEGCQTLEKTIGKRNLKNSKESPKKPLKFLKDVAINPT
jgi:hypothetical protein